MDKGTARHKWHVKGDAKQGKSTFWGWGRNWAGQGRGRTGSHCKWTQSCHGVYSMLPARAAFPPTPCLDFQFWIQLKMTRHPVRKFLSGQPCPFSPLPRRIMNRARPKTVLDEQSRMNVSFALWRFALHGWVLQRVSVCIRTWLLPDCA